MKIDARAATKGRWRGILSALGVDQKFLRDVQGPCPFCEGRTRYRFSDKDGDGLWICNRCGAGNGFQLLMRLRGIDFPSACKLALSVVGSAAVEPNRSKAAWTEDQRMNALRQLWKASRPLTEGNMVLRYLRGRGIAMRPPYPEDLRFCAECPVKGVAGVRTLPAMLAFVRSPDGKVVTAHRTYLGAHGGKADMPDPRKLFPGAIPDGSSIRLGPIGDTLGVAEGIETALAAMEMFGHSVWAAISSVMMKKFAPPSEVAQIIIYGDCDESFTGQAAAFELARVLASRRSGVEVRLPDSGDWNDVLLRERREAA